MDGIDPQVLEDHLQLVRFSLDQFNFTSWILIWFLITCQVDHLIESQFSEKITTFENVQVEPLQVLD